MTNNNNEAMFTLFLNSLNAEEARLAVILDNKLCEKQCGREIKEAASGYSVAYKSSADKKTIAAFICRKSGLKIRLTPQKPYRCDDLCDSLPDNMRKDMIRGNECKRLSNANVCNQHCLMGYTFTLDGIVYKQCRAMSFLFSVTETKLPYILALINRNFDRQ